MNSTKTQTPVKHDAETIKLAERMRGYDWTTNAYHARRKAV